MRLITEFGPRGRTAGRYCGDCTAAGVADGDAAGLFEGDAADLEGLAAGFTSTSAAKRVSAANAAAARVNQSLSIECLRNAVLALSQDQFFRLDRDCRRVRLLFVRMISVSVATAG